MCDNTEMSKVTYPNWFAQTAQENFEEHLKEFIGKDNLLFLQIGAFTGDASVWLADNILTGTNSVLVDVDTWAGSDEEVHDAMDFDDVFKTYLEKVKDKKNIEHYQSKSIDFLPIINGEFDFIYIDGDHTASGVIDDAIFSWRMLKPGGIMAFDDYTWTSTKGKLFEPSPSINYFMWVKQHDLTPITMNGQLWVRKNDNKEVAQG